MFVSSGVPPSGLQARIGFPKIFTESIKVLNKNKLSGGPPFILILNLPLVFFAGV